MTLPSPAVCLYHRIYRGACSQAGLKHIIARITQWHGWWAARLRSPLQMQAPHNDQHRRMAWTMLAEGIWQQRPSLLHPSRSGMGILSSSEYPRQRKLQEFTHQAPALLAVADFGGHDAALHLPDVHLDPALDAGSRVEVAVGSHNQPRVCASLALQGVDVLGEAAQQQALGGQQAHEAVRGRGLVGPREELLHCASRCWDAVTLEGFGEDVVCLTLVRLACCGCAGVGAGCKVLACKGSVQRQGVGFKAVRREHGSAAGPIPTTAAS